MPKRTVGAKAKPPTKKRKVVAAAAGGRPAADGLLMFDPAAVVADVAHDYATVGRLKAFAETLLERATTAATTLETKEAKKVAAASKKKAISLHKRGACNQCNAQPAEHESPLEECGCYLGSSVKGDGNDGVRGCDSCLDQLKEDDEIVECSQCSELMCSGHGTCEISRCTVCEDVFCEQHCDLTSCSCGEVNHCANCVEDKRCTECETTILCEDGCDTESCHNCGKIFCPDCVEESTCEQVKACQSCLDKEGGWTGVCVDCDMCAGCY